jgi:6-phosphogluconolactonase (cycloisomerase 2 family)
MRTTPESRTGHLTRALAAAAKPRLAWLAILVGAGSACDHSEVPTGLASDAPETQVALQAGGGAVPGAVYTITNAASNNEVLVYPRHADGTIGSPSAVSTGGDGNGGGLGSQGAVTLSGNGRWLLAVNAGTHDVSVFRTGGHGTQLTDRAPSGGEMPVSVDIYGDLVYVVNAGVPNNVTGFRLSPRGELTEIPGSSRPLSADATAPAQVSFTDQGRTLVVTEKATNTITIYPVDRQSGLLGTHRYIDSEGATPFGFAFDAQGRLFVSEAFGGAAGASALSSYAPGSFETISPAVGSGESAACWVLLTKDGGLAFVTNTASGTVSTYAIADDGSVSLLHAVAASTGGGSGPIDMALSRDGRFVYVLASGNGTVRPYAINDDGTLSGLGPIPGLPSSAFGLAAR